MKKMVGDNLTTDGIPQTTDQRIVSIDALRGFTMLFIIGGGAFLSRFHTVWPNPVTACIAKHMKHAGWEGFYFMDLIFPQFLFLVELLLPIVMQRRRGSGLSPIRLHAGIVRRTLVLVFLGLVNYGLLCCDWPNMRWSSVLGRIGICYFVAALFVVHTHWKVEVAVVLVILAGYWAAVRFIPVPGHGVGVLTPEGCLTTWLDQKLIPGKLGLGLYDRQGVLSTFTSLATTLIGCLGGHWLLTSKTERQKTLGLVLAGLVTLTLGWMWGKVFFISRNVWTSSFVLYAAGWSLLLFSLFYWAIDVKGYRRWTFPLVVVGMNAITIWVGQRVIDFGFTSDYLFSGVAKYLGVAAPVFLAFTVLLIKWLFLYGLYRKRIFLRA